MKVTIRDYSYCWKGFLFGTFLGALYANIGATLGALVAFLLVRYSLGAAIQERYAQELMRFNQMITSFRLFVP